LRWSDFFLNDALLLKGPKHWHPQPLAWDALPQRFQFVRSPQRAAAQA
jgi:hypothetical protein